MTCLRDALSHAVNVLDGHGVEDARVEARLIAQHALGVTTAELLCNPDAALSPEKMAALEQLVRRRACREPFAYIVNSQPFYGRDLYVDSRVLIPRPETELLVEKAIECAAGCPPHCIVDVGTGSGAIAISLALALPSAIVYATDVSAEVLEVARANCIRHGVEDRVVLLRGNLLDPVPGLVDLVVANLPYVADCDLPALAPEIGRFEPRLALSGGADGLAIVGALVRQVGARLEAGGSVLLEFGHGQQEGVLSLVDRFLPGAETHVYRDPGGLSRVLRATARQREKEEHGL